MTLEHRRYKLQRRATPVAVPELPRLYDWLAWQPSHADLHAAVKHLAFAQTPDAVLFPNLGSLTGCRYLTASIRDHDDFCPLATWLIVGPDGAVGCIQGLLDERQRLGTVQNLAVVPGHRGVGLGRALLLQCVAGFEYAGARNVALDVTASNSAALKLYARAGFRRVRESFHEPTAPRGVE
jgi:GNAT superfamily N-acetyltransferase